MGSVLWERAVGLFLTGCRGPKVCAAVVLLALTPLLAACVTTEPHTLSVDSVRALRLERVDVVLDPAAPIAWSGLAQEIRDARKGPNATTERTYGEAGPEEVKIPAAELRALAASRLREKVGTFTEPSLKSSLSGTKPVVTRITVHDVRIPGTGEQIAVGLAFGLLAGPVAAGSASVNSTMAVSVDFVDPRTGSPILSYPRTTLVTQGGYKLNMGTSGVFSHDPIERMLADLNNRLTSWLLKG